MIKKVAHVRNYLYHTCATLLYTLLISLIDKRRFFSSVLQSDFLYTFVFSISWLLKPSMYAYK